MRFMVRNHESIVSPRLEVWLNGRALAKDAPGPGFHPQNQTHVHTRIYVGRLQVLS